MGHHNRHYYGDPHCDAGVFGVPTSKANFCEEDYAFTLYLAEFVNTVTNLAYVYLALRYPRKPGTRGGTLGMDGLSLALFVLGLNSALFHATMHQATQFCDEVSMLLLAGALLNAVYEIDQTPEARNLVRAAIGGVLGVVSFLYIRSSDILFHVYAFNAMIFLVGCRTLYLIYGRGKYTRDQQCALIGQMLRSIVILVASYSLWQVDLEYCAELRGMRAALGLPLAWLLELHGWWHIGTAWGASEHINLIRNLS